MTFNLKHLLSKSGSAGGGTGSFEQVGSGACPAAASCYKGATTGVTGEGGAGAGAGVFTRLLSRRMMSGRVGSTDACLHSDPRGRDHVDTRGRDNVDTRGRIAPQHSAILIDQGQLIAKNGAVEVQGYVRTVPGHSQTRPGVL